MFLAVFRYSVASEQRRIAGIHGSTGSPCILSLSKDWVPAFAGMTSYSMNKYFYSQPKGCGYLTYLLIKQKPVTNTQ